MADGTDVSAVAVKPSEGVLPFSVDEADEESSPFAPSRDARREWCASGEVGVAAGRGMVGEVGAMMCLC